MDIPIEKLAKILKCCESTVKVYCSRIGHIDLGQRDKTAHGVTDADIKEMKALIHTRKKQKDYVYNGKGKPVIDKEEMKKRYYQLNKDDHCGANCFDFCFSYQIGDKNTCYYNPDHPTVCRVLRGLTCRRTKQ